MAHIQSNSNSQKVPKNEIENSKLIFNLCAVLLLTQTLATLGWLLNNPGKNLSLTVKTLIL